MFLTHDQIHELFTVVMISIVLTIHKRALWRLEHRVIQLEDISRG